MIHIIVNALGSLLVLYIMGKPNMGNSPTKQKIVSVLESNIDNTYSYGPVRYADYIGDVLIFQSETYPIQIELEPVGSGWAEEFDAIIYRVYEVPPDGTTFKKENKKHFDIPHNPDISWDNAISDILLSLSGIINGAINNGHIEKKN